MSLFRNPWPHAAHGFLDIVRWKSGWTAKEPARIPDAPDDPAGWRSVSREEIARPPDIGWRVTWLGHASFLLQGAGSSILIDPVFARYCAPLPIPSLRRKVPVPCALEDLPEIDLILLTHTHYDHLDLTTLRTIGQKTPIIIAEGHAAWLRGKGFENVSELAWHAAAEVVPGLRVTATPAQHFTARSPFDRDRGHWCGFLIEGAGCKLWHAGDSGYCGAFTDIGARHGLIDFGMIPIGAYNPRRIMEAMHMNPEEAVRAFEETRCRRAVAMHWGTFKLTDEPMGEPVILLEIAMKQKSLAAEKFNAGRVGDIWEVLPRSI
jgi:N-acyl-phosphatidylethanolamine-hydrolysing phospholipase D